MGVRVRITLSESDRARYGGPDTLTLDVDALADLPASELDRLETEVFGDRSLADWAQAYEAGRAWARRAAAWLARHQAGIAGPFAEFDPATVRATYRAEVVDADPPDFSTSSDTSESAPS